MRPKGPTPSGSFSQFFLVLSERAQVVFLLKLFAIEQNVVRTFHRADQLIELDLCRRRVAVPRGLYQEAHQERDDRGRHVELPGVAIVTEQAGDYLNDHEGDGHHKGGGSTGHRGKVARQFRIPLAAHHDLR